MGSILRRLVCATVPLLVTVSSFPLFAEAYEADARADRFTPQDVFELEWATDPQISPDGRYVAYVRRHMDVMKDRARGDVWLLDRDQGTHRPVTQTGSATTPRWSPSGDRLLYVAMDEGSGGAQLFVRFTDSGESMRLTRLTESPGSPSWSPAGDRIAFSMAVPAKSSDMIKMPKQPEGATWAPEADVIDSLIYRRDGRGYVDPAHQHLFVVPADGGTARQVTSGDFDHGGTPSWTADGEALVFSANRHADHEDHPNNSELYRVDLKSGDIEALTDRYGPDGSPLVSPDGKKVAYVGYDDRLQGFQQPQLYVMDLGGGKAGKARVLTTELDREIEQPQWIGDSSGLFFAYSDHGVGKIAKVDLAGKITRLAEHMGGTSIGRPYSGGSFSASDDGVLAYTWGRAPAPADVAVWEAGKLEMLTDLSSDLLDHKVLAEVEEINFKSSFDGRDVQGWVAKPPGFDPKKKYPLLLEIHGGPFADYGDRWSTEVQLFAAAGYVVLYINPRGSSSYGEEFGNLIHHNYPSQDYDDLISGVDAVIEQGYVDPDRLFVTGGSGGGVLTAWIVGKTDRFRAAVSVKPVINWYSFVLTADSYNFFYKYWFPGPPWEHAEHYLKRSPLSLVGNVTTPTMLMTGEADYRTPISETEQYYQALKIRDIETAMVRIPEASHGIAARPSHLISKVLHILAWFERFDEKNP